MQELKFHFTIDKSVKILMQAIKHLGHGKALEHLWYANSDLDKPDWNRWLRPVLT